MCPSARRAKTAAIVFNRKPQSAEPPKFLQRVLGAMTSIRALVLRRRPRKPETPPQNPAIGRGPNIEDLVPNTSEEAVAWIEAMVQAIRDLAAEMIAAGALHGIDVEAAVEAERRELNKPPASPKAALKTTTAPPPHANLPPSAPPAPRASLASADPEARPAASRKTSPHRPPHPQNRRPHRPPPATRSAPPRTPFPTPKRTSRPSPHTVARPFRSVIVTQ